MKTLKAFVEQSAMDANGVTMVIRVGPGDEAHIKAALDMRGRSIVIGLSGPINVAEGRLAELRLAVEEMDGDASPHQGCGCEQCMDLRIAVEEAKK